MLPKGWKSTTLGSVLERVVQPVKVEPSREYREIGIRSHGKGIFHKHPVLGESLGDKRVFWVTADALVLNIVFAWEQAVAVTSERENGMIASHRFPMYRPKNARCDIEYLRQFFCTKRGKDLLESASPGGAGRNKTLGREAFERLRIPLPSIDEQKRIRSALQTWDRAIAVIDGVVRTLRDQKIVLARVLLTGQRRLASNPKAWSSVRLDKLCEVRRGASPRPIDDPKWFSDKGRGWIRISDLTASTGRELVSTAQYLSEAGVARSVSVDPGDLVMSICASIGVAKRIGIPACIHDGFVVFRECDPNLSLDFLYYHLEFIARSLVKSGQAGTQKNLNTSIVGGIKVPSIPRDEQETIAQVLMDADREIQLATAYANRLRNEKAALMQQLLTGKRRVRVPAAEAAP